MFLLVVKLIWVSKILAKISLTGKEIDHLDFIKSCESRLKSCQSALCSITKRSILEHLFHTLARSFNVIYHT